MAAPITTQPQNQYGLHPLEAHQEVQATDYGQNSIFSGSSVPGLDVFARNDIIKIEQKVKKIECKYQRFLSLSSSFFFLIFIF